jgi:hypothetical protein
MIGANIAVDQHQKEPCTGCFPMKNVTIQVIVKNRNAKIPDGTIGRTYTNNKINDMI